MITQLHRYHRRISAWLCLAAMLFAQTAYAMQACMVVKAAVFETSTLKSSQINVETYKGTVQLTGVVSSSAENAKAVEVAKGVNGVKSVKNDMILRPATK